MVTDVVGKAQFDELINKSTKLVLVDFWAEWCGPCRMLGPVLHDLAEKYPEQVEVVKINVDETENQDISMEYAVRSIPQVTLFKDGAVVDQFIWALPPEQVEEIIAKNLSDA